MVSRVMAEPVSEGDWVEITVNDISRLDSDPSVDKTPDQPCSDVDYVEDVILLFHTSIGGTIHTTLDALHQRWGGSKGDVIKSLSHIGATTAVDVFIRWSDQAVRITRLFVGQTWGVFGSQPHADA